VDYCLPKDVLLELIQSRLSDAESEGASAHLLMKQRIANDAGPECFPHLCRRGNGGYVHRATDDPGLQAVRKKAHVRDRHATIVHLLGFDHKRFALLIYERACRVISLMIERFPSASHFRFRDFCSRRGGHRCVSNVAASL
jgi:hypothetical protein